MFSTIYFSATEPHHGDTNPAIKEIVSRDWGGLQIVSLSKYEVETIPDSEHRWSSLNVSPRKWHSGKGSHLQSYGTTLEQFAPRKLLL
jgi:hypothetical protein